MKPSPLAEKSLLLATKIVIMYEEQTKIRKDTTILKQLLRSGTSVGANINEAVFGNSKADFISKLHISLKEANESLYWLKLLNSARIIEQATANEFINLTEEIKAMLIASLNTAKNNKE